VSSDKVGGDVEQSAESADLVWEEDQGQLGLQTSGNLERIGDNSRRGFCTHP
jgi:hypothetical protein